LKLSSHIIDKPLAIVDIETTGGNAMYSRIIDVAVIRIERGKVVKKFQSLINPERFIPPSIEQLTGITNDDVADAPTFRSVARELFKALEGAVFVAHNDRFYYSFINNEYRRLGKEFSAKCLCTVKLSRKLFPEHRHHDLNSVIQRHNIVCEDRHRAMGDAKAVFDFLTVIQDEVTGLLLEKAVRAILRTSSLPSNLDKESIDALPETPGVYLLYGKEGEVLYVGKSVCIR
ncbi:MAG: exonuclease domain-containing protein, partial [Bacteroidota bacterium]